MTEPATVGVDVGGTLIKARLCDDKGDTLAEWRLPTPAADRDGRRTVAAVTGVVREAADIRPVAAVGVAIPGLVDEDRGVCLHSVNLGWRDLPIGRMLGDELGLSPVVAHDVRAGAVGEKVTGAGRDRPGRLAFVPLGTGIAIAVVDDDLRPLAGPGSGEVGQIRLTSGRHAGATIEQLASAGGIARRARRENAEAVAGAVRAGDRLAAEVWQDGVAVLADVLTWLITLTAPATVVIGGGLAHAGAALFEPLSASVRAQVPDFLPVELVPARHGSAAAAVGAAYLAARTVAPRRP